MAKYATEHLCIYDRIQYIINFPETVNVQGRTMRASHWCRAIEEARDILPEGKMKRGLDYLCRNPEAKLYFGGNDIIRPALQEALRLMREENSEEYFMAAV